MPEDEALENVAAIHDYVSHLSDLKDNLDAVIANPQNYTIEEIIEQMTYARIVIDNSIEGARIMTDDTNANHADFKKVMNDVM